MDKLVLTANQIYALAHILKAQYLDYYYIALADRNVDGLWLSENTKSLVAQGILTEDFSGDTSIDSKIENLLKPLYFSKKESSLDINIFGEKEDNIGYRFHFLDDEITMTKTVEDGLEISNVSTDEIIEIVSQILPSGYSGETVQTNVEIETENVSRIFVAKRTDVDGKNMASTFVESDGVVYMEIPDDTDDQDNLGDLVYSVSEEDFVGQLCKILAEV